MDDTGQGTSVAQRVIRWLIVVLVLALIGFGIYSMVAQLSTPSTAVTLGSTVLDAEVVDTAELRELGLSGRSGLGRDQAMLFVFEHDGKWSIWMKDMKFPIDAVWLDGNKRVVHVAKNLQPDVEPYTTYSPGKPARYIIELPAGAADKLNIRLGSPAEFDLDEEAG